VSFTDALDEHLAAIRARDLRRLAATVSARGVRLVTAQGEVSTDPGRFLALHADWFRATTWSIATRLLHAQVGTDVATCLLALEYRDDPPDGVPVREVSVLGLTFALEDGRWVLVQDQNTPCRRNGG
jgi:ketosteroid isomerase-like protein